MRRHSLRRGKASPPRASSGVRSHEAPGPWMPQPRLQRGFRPRGTMRKETSTKTRPSRPDSRARPCSRDPRPTSTRRASPRTRPWTRMACRPGRAGTYSAAQISMMAEAIPAATIRGQVHIFPWLCQLRPPRSVTQRLPRWIERVFETSAPLYPLGHTRCRLFPASPAAEWCMSSCRSLDGKLRRASVCPSPFLGARCAGGICLKQTRCLCNIPA